MAATVSGRRETVAIFGRIRRQTLYIRDTETLETFETVSIDLLGLISLLIGHCLTVSLNRNRTVSWPQDVLPIPPLIEHARAKKALDLSVGRGARHAGYLD